MIDAASGGALGDMTPFEARNFFIEKMASNSQQFSARNDVIVLRGVHKVTTNIHFKHLTSKHPQRPNKFQTDPQPKIASISFIPVNFPSNS